MIAKVVKWQNGMVMVFDERGDQLPDYQGRADECRDAIRRDAAPSTTFWSGEWRTRELTPLRPEDL